LSPFLRRVAFADCQGSHDDLAWLYEEGSNFAARAQQPQDSLTSWFIETRSSASPVASPHREAAKRPIVELLTRCPRWLLSADAHESDSSADFEPFRRVALNAQEEAGVGRVLCDESAAIDNSLVSDRRSADVPAEAESSKSSLKGEHRLSVAPSLADLHE
jgi:hypothetical protein